MNIVPAIYNWSVTHNRKSYNIIELYIIENLNDNTLLLSMLSYYDITLAALGMLCNRSIHYHILDFASPHYTEVFFFFKWKNMWLEIHKYEAKFVMFHLKPPVYIT